MIPDGKNRQLSKKALGDSGFSQHPHTVADDKIFRRMG
jgi:hypothetical protein